MNKKANLTIDETQERTLERIRTLLKILQFPTENTKEFLDYALNEAIQLTYSKIGYICFYDDLKQEFNVNTWSKEVMKECSITDPQTVFQLKNTGLWGEAVRQQKTIIVNDYDQPNPYKKGYPKGHSTLKKFLTVPIFNKNRIVAVIGVGNKQTDYDESDALQLSLLMDAVWKVFDRKLAYTALQESEAKLKSLINASEDVVVLKDKDFKHIMVNLAAQKFFHRTEEEIIGKTDFDLMPEDSAENCRSSDKEALEKNQLIENFEQVEDHYFIAHKFPVPLGSQIGVGGFITDITRQVNADASIRLQSKALEVAANAILITDPEGSIEWANQAFSSLTGYSIEEIRGRNPRDLVHSGMQDKNFYVSLWETIKGGKNWEGVMIDRKKDGSLFTEEMTITPLMDERKRILHFIAIIQDISEREQREKELTVIANVSYALRNTQTRAEMYPAILDQLLEQLNIEAATIDLLDPITDEMVVELGRGLWANATGLRIPPGQGLSRKVMDSGKAYVNNNNYVSPETYYKDIFGNCLASAAIPLSVRDQKIGTIFIGANRKIDARDIRLLKSVADIAASAINRAFLYEKTQEKVRQLDSLRVIDQAISTSFDLNVTLNVILKQSQEMLGCDALTVLLSKPQTMMLENAANLGFQSDEIKRLNFHIGYGLAGQSIMERRIISMDLRDSVALPSEAQFFVSEGFESVHSAPLAVKGNLKGVMIICYSKPMTQTPEWLELFSTLATQTAIAIENYELFDRMQKSSLNLSVAYDATIESLTKAVELRGYESGEKLKQIAQMTVSLAYEMGFKNESIGDIMRGAYLHDIGNIKIPDTILNKKGKLTKEEWAIVRGHPQNAVDMLSSIKYLKPALDIPYCHHEKWDGSGYPRGLKGEGIPLAARVFSIVDVWNALISDRPFRKAWSKNKAKDYILSQSGSHFDPQIVKVFYEKFLS